jgi:hypothetical protein
LAEISRLRINAGKAITNIVLVETTNSGFTTPETVRRSAEQGLANAIMPDTVRSMTHV